MKRFRAAVFFALPIFFVSCATTAINQNEILVEPDNIQKEIIEPETEAEDEAELDAEDDGISVIKFSGRGIKCEIESMELENCLLVDDSTASAGKAVKWGKNSRASLEMELPQGTFEILFSQKAWYTNGSHFSVAVGEKKYELYPSEPPLGNWELTLRKPAIYKNDAQAVVTVTVESGEGFLLDYFQIVRISE